MAPARLTGVDVNPATGVMNVTPCWGEVVHPSQRTGDTQAHHAMEALANLMKDKNSTPFYEQKKSHGRPHAGCNEPPPESTAPDTLVDTTSLLRPGLFQWPPTSNTPRQTPYVTPPRRPVAVQASVDVPTPTRAPSGTLPPVGRLSEHSSVMNTLEKLYDPPPGDSNGGTQGTKIKVRNVLRKELRDPVEGSAKREARTTQEDVTKEVESSDGRAQAGNGLHRSATLSGFGFTVGVSFSFKYEHH